MLAEQRVDDFNDFLLVVTGQFADLFEDQARPTHRPAFARGGVLMPYEKINRGPHNLGQLSELLWLECHGASLPKGVGLLRDPQFFSHLLLGQPFLFPERKEPLAKRAARSFGGTTGTHVVRIRPITDRVKNRLHSYIRSISTLSIRIEASWPKTLSRISHRVKQANDLASLIQSKGVKLVRKGKQWVGLCPFHNDHEPSLIVDPRKQLWNCLGVCREGGDVYKFVMKSEGLDFRQTHLRLGGQKYSCVPRTIFWRRCGRALDGRCARCSLCRIRNAAFAKVKSQQKKKHYCYVLCTISRNSLPGA